MKLYTAAAPAAAGTGAGAGPAAGRGCMCARSAASTAARVQHPPDQILQARCGPNCESLPVQPLEVRLAFLRQPPPQGSVGGRQLLLESQAVGHSPGLASAELRPTRPALSRATTGSPAKADA